MGCRGPALRGMPSTKRTASFEPSGEKLGASTLPFNSTRLVGELVPGATVHTWAAGAVPVRSARKASCLESEDQQTLRRDISPSTATFCEEPLSTEATVSLPATM